MRADGVWCIPIRCAPHPPQVDTTVSQTTPQQRAYATVLAERCEPHERFIHAGVDDERRKGILEVVSDAVGVTDIETEQCREQEQEREQEQHQVPETPARPRTKGRARA